MGNAQTCYNYCGTEDKPHTCKEPIRITMKRKYYPPIQCIAKGQIGIITTPPILNNENQIIFLSTNNKSTTYSIYDLNKSEFILKSQQIKCDTDTFDIANTVYTYNPNNNKIYFIENNKNLLSFDMSKSKITTLNKTITTKHNNYAIIQYNNNKVYIIGDEQKSDVNDEYVVIPYSSAKRLKRAKEYDEVIKNAGWNSRVINVSRNNTNYIYIIGGKKNYSRTSKPQIYPNDAIWTLNLVDNNGKHLWNWSDKQQKVSEYYFQQPQHSFGIINYKNKYLICFGGAEFKRMSVKTASYIWILCLCEKNKYLLTQNIWYELYVRLPANEYYHSIYSENNKTETIHLFSYFGKYYTIEMKDIFSELKNGKYVKLHSWTQMGKTVVPTHSKSLENLPPKDDTQVDEMLEELGKEYEKYANDLGTAGFDTYDDILNGDKQNKLNEIVKNADHRSIIKDKAQILKGN